jgi:DNA-binding MarR family transcriptional regulator
MNRTHAEESQGCIAEALERAAALLVRHLREPGDLSLTSAAVLSTLRADGPLRLTVLAAAAGVSQPSMTQLVQRLEGEGLATRVNDPEDRRGTLVGITDAGRTLLADLRRARRARLAELLTTLSVEDEATLKLAMHVALPIFERLVDSVTQGRVAGDAGSSRSPRAACGHLLVDAGSDTTDDGRSLARARPACRVTGAG